MGGVENFCSFKEREYHPLRHRHSKSEIAKADNWFLQAFHEVWEKDHPGVTPSWANSRQKGHDHGKKDHRHNHGKKDHQRDYKEHDKREHDQRHDHKGKHKEQDRDGKHKEHDHGGKHKMNYHVGKHKKHDHEHRDREG